MSAFTHTPPLPRARLPSLEPYNPLSGTVGVSPGRRRRRVDLSFAPTSSSSFSQALSPREKLEALTAQILQVLKAYANTPMHSLVYLAHLKDFYRKALDLDPNANPDDSAETICQAPSPSGAFPPGPSPGKGRASFKLDKTILPRRDSSGTVMEPNAMEVDKLEREWWSSEIVAAWYGPRPGSRTVGGRQKNKGETERDVIVKRDASFVGLYDE